MKRDVATPLVIISLIALALAGAGLYVLRREIAHREDAECLALDVFARTTADRVGRNVQATLDDVLRQLAATHGSPDLLKKLEKTSPWIADAGLATNAQETASAPSHGARIHWGRRRPWEQTAAVQGWEVQTDDSLGAELGDLVGWTRFATNAVGWVRVPMVLMLARVPAWMEQPYRGPDRPPNGRVLAGEVRDTSGRMLCPTDRDLSPRVFGEANLSPWLPYVKLRLSWRDADAIVAAARAYMWSGGLVLLLTAIGLFWLGGYCLVHRADAAHRIAKQKTDFLANVSHELRNPLAGIRVQAELLEQGVLAAPDAQTKAAQFILKETDRLTAMVNDLLDFSRLERHALKFTCAPFDVKALCDELAETFRPKFARHGLTHSAPKGPAFFASDENAVRRIVANLLDNAAKYAGDDGPVHLDVMCSDERLEATVSDVGPGIPKGCEERIFERFERLDNALARKANGYGLGLALARELARGLGGELAVRRLAPHGCAFTLTVPMGKETHDGERTRG